MYWGVNDLIAFRLKQDCEMPDLSPDMILLPKLESSQSTWRYGGTEFDLRVFRLS